MGRSTLVNCSSCGNTIDEGICADCGEMSAEENNTLREENTRLREQLAAAEAERDSSRIEYAHGIGVLVICREAIRTKHEELATDALEMTDAFLDDPKLNAISEYLVKLIAERDGLRLELARFHDAERLHVAYQDAQVHGTVPLIGDSPGHFTHENQGVTREVPRMTNSGLREAATLGELVMRMPEGCTLRHQLRFGDIPSNWVCDPSSSYRGIKYADTPADALRAALGEGVGNG